MFFVDYERFYEVKYKQKFNSANAPSVLKKNSETVSDNSDNMQANVSENSLNPKNNSQTFNKLKSKVQNAARFADAAVVRSAKNVVDYAKSDDAADKFAATKEKFLSGASGVGNAVSGLGGKSSAFISSKKKNSDQSVDERSDDICSNQETVCKQSAEKQEAEYDKINSDNAEHTDSDVSVNRKNDSFVNDYTESNSVETIYKSGTTISRSTPVDDIQNNEVYEDNNSFIKKTDGNVLTESVRNSIVYKRTSQGWKIVDNTIPSPAPMNTSSIYNPEAYSYEKEKKPEFNSALIGIIVFLLIGIGALFIILFKQKNAEIEMYKNAVSNNKVVYDSESKTDKNSTEEITENTLKKESENTIDSNTEEETQSDIEVPIINDKIVTICSPEEINNYHIYLDIAKNSTYSDSYFLCDINYDGTPELFLTSNGSNEWIDQIYSIYNNNAVMLADGTGNMSRGLALCKNGIVLRAVADGASRMINAYEEYVGGDSLNLIEYIEWDEGTPFHIVGDQKVEITTEQVENINSKYNHMLFNSTAISSLKTIESETKNKKIPSEYKDYENIKNAPADMQFYTVNNIATGYVATESTSLNMRAGAGMDYKVVQEIPRAAAVEILGSNSEWYYVRYFTGGVGAFAVNFYGYVSKQYISSSPVIIETVEVYSCDIEGQINTHGLGVAGFATSYVVDGGDVSEIRHRLGNGWHVTAVRCCYSKEVMWYELYDSDDGDYYGWVDSEYIDFQ